jgi:hypothetical protein
MQVAVSQGAASSCQPPCFGKVFLASHSVLSNIAFVHTLCTGGGESRRSPKLTATLLQRHEASGGGTAPGHPIGVSHPDFAPDGMTPGDVDLTPDWDQVPATLRQQQQQQQWPQAPRHVG